MKPVTIDQLDIKDHVRWAEDQEQYDVSLIKESSLVAPHPEILGLSLIYSSKLEELFDLQKRNQPYASFPQPKNFYLFSRRFFSHRLFPSIHFEEEEDEEGNSNSEDLIQTILRAQKPSDQTHTLFEKDKSAIVELLQEIKSIDQLLKQIYARKLQYQKG